MATTPPSLWLTRERDHFQSLVLGSFHYLALTRPLVVDAAEMEDPVADDTIELKKKKLEK